MSEKVFTDLARYAVHTSGMSNTITPNRFLIQPSSERPEGIAPYIPRPARRPHEIARRKSRPSGTLILEEQHQGLALITIGANQLSSPEEVAEWAQYGAAACIGSGPYMLNGTVMNRYIALPMLGAEMIADRPDSTELHERAVLKLARAAELAGKTLIAHEQCVPKRFYNRLALATGKATVEAALELTCVPLGDFTADPGNYLSNRDVQHLVRQRCMRAVHAANTLGVELGTYPSAAQLTDPISPLAVALQASGGDTAVRTYERLI